MQLNSRHLVDPELAAFLDLIPSTCSTGYPSASSCSSSLLSRNKRSCQAAPMSLIHCTSKLRSKQSLSAPCQLTQHALGDIQRGARAAEAARLLAHHCQALGLAQQD